MFGDYKKDFFGFLVAELELPCGRREPQAQGGTFAKRKFQPTLLIKTKGKITLILMQFKIVYDPVDLYFLKPNLKKQ